VQLACRQKAMMPRLRRSRMLLVNNSFISGK
jgi:hypothetical protein